jgi:hypothetical protein
MDSLDRAIHRMLKQPRAGRLIRSYGVAAFTSSLRWNLWFGRRETFLVMGEREPLPIAVLMIQVLENARRADGCD